MSFLIPLLRVLTTLVLLLAGEEQRVLSFQLATAPQYQKTSFSCLHHSPAEAEAEARAKRAQKVKEDLINYPPNILAPFPEAADPNYKNKGEIGKGDFVISREGGPTKEELTDENLYRIVVRRSNVTDLEVNTLVWKCLGYRFDPDKEQWTAAEVFPKWKERFPDPPDLIGCSACMPRKLTVPVSRITNT